MLEIAIRRRTAVSMLFLGLTILGYISYRNLPVELLPNVEFPFLIVEIRSFQETNPSEIERDAVIPLEEAIGTLDGIDKIVSQADRQSGRIFIFYQPATHLKYAFLKLSEKIDNVSASLPAGYVAQVVKVDISQFANTFMNLQVRGGGSVDQLRTLVERQIRQELEAVDGVAAVQVFGGRERSVEVVIDEQKAAANGVTTGQIRELLRRNNAYKRFVGDVRHHQKRYPVNVTAEYQSTEDLAKVVVDPRGPVLLGDVAKIRNGFKVETSLSRVNAQEAVTIQLMRSSQSNVIDVAARVRPVIDRLNKRLDSQQIEIVIETDQSEYLQGNIDLIKDLAITGAILAVFILWYFIGNLRLITVIALTIPISVFTAFNLFYAFDISLNSLTLVGMALAVGMLVDNSIVVLENIYRLTQRGLSPLQATLDGTREVWRSIVAATLTTVCVFVPFVFAENFLIRTLGYQIGISIIATLLVSLLVALILIPMTTYYLVDGPALRKSRLHRFSLKQKLMRRYTLLLKSAMRKPLLTIGLTLLLFLISILVAMAQSFAMAGEEAASEMNLYLTMRAGSNLDITDAAASDIEQRLLDLPELQDVISQIYEEEAVFTLRLKKDYLDIKGRLLPEIRSEIDDRLDSFRGGDVGFEKQNAGGRFGGGPPAMDVGLESLLGVGGLRDKIVLRGQDNALMQRIAEDLRYQLRTMPSIAWTNLSLSANRPEIHLLFNRQLMDALQIPVSAVASELSTFDNEVNSGVSFRNEGTATDILLTSTEQESRQMDNLRRMRITSATGARYPLEQISEILQTTGESSIARLNQERLIELSYGFIDEVQGSSPFLEQARDEVEQIVSASRIPAGIAVEVQNSQADLTDFYFLISLAFVLIIMILSSVFESLLTPLLILFTIPLAAIGSLWAIIFTGNSLLNANSFIGLLILLGIVVNNGIILIDYARLLRNKGYRFQRALLTAGQARLRPILITASTTIVAMIPLAMGRMEYVTQIASPFAVTVIGGLLFSTLFTLILIPTAYSGLENFLSWMRGLPMPIRILQALLLVLGGWLIFNRVEGFVWRMMNLFLLVFIIPGFTYFLRSTLRRASGFSLSTESMRIEISNLHKIYDWPSGFIRAWRRDGINSEQGNTILSPQALWQSSWHFFVLGFFYYFTYGYLLREGWKFFLIHPIYFYSLYLLHKLQPLLLKLLDKFSPGARIARQIPRAFKWLFPAANLWRFAMVWESPALVVFVGVLWFGALWIDRSGRKLSSGQVRIPHIKGRLSGIRKAFYTLVEKTPMIGKRKAPFSALNGVSLNIETGMFGLLGPNGAGKTTLMRIICGILEPSYGKITINGINVREKREELQGLIGYLPQDFGTYENMTAREFLAYQAILKGIVDPQDRRRRVGEVIASVHLEDRQDDKISGFSGGMKQRIGIAQTLLHLPKILVVDEPTAGLDPRERIRFRNLLVDLSRERIVIFSTHVIEDIASSCEQVAVMNKGEIRYLGHPRHLAENAEGKVWQFDINPEQLEKISQEWKVVHNMKDKGNIRVRVLAETQPHPQAIHVQPTLEDAYIWTLQG